VHLVAFIIRIYHDARSSECQIYHDFVKQKVLLLPHICEWQLRALSLCTNLPYIWFGAGSNHTEYASVSRRVLTAEAWFRCCRELTAKILNWNKICTPSLTNICLFYCFKCCQLVSAQLTTFETINKNIVVTDGVHILFQFNILLLTQRNILYRDYS
jgi:hypothetical protein